MCYQVWQKSSEEKGRKQVNDETYQPNEMICHKPYHQEDRPFTEYTTFRRETCPKLNKGIKRKSSILQEKKSMTIDVRWCAAATSHV